jgi:hypothetical protein
MESVAPSRRLVLHSVCRSDFGFLGTSPFRCEIPDYEGWFCLDFLGFSRPNRDFSMAYTDKREKDFSSRFRRRERAVESASHDLAYERDGLHMGQAYLNF